MCLRNRNAEQNTQQAPTPGTGEGEPGTSFTVTPELTTGMNIADIPTWETTNYVYGFAMFTCERAFQNISALIVGKISWFFKWTSKEINKKE